MSKINDQYEDMMTLKGWTEATKRTYRSLLFRFQNDFKGKDIYGATTDELISYIASMKSRAVMAQMYGVLKNLYTHVLKQPRKFGFIPFPKSGNHLPNLITHDEMLKIIDFLSYIKHKVILHLLYGTGLRSFELCKAKWSDIERTDSPNNPLLLKVKGKGNVERRVPISKSLNTLLIKYCKAEKLKCDNSNDYIFGGKKPYSKRSVAAIVEKASNGKLTPHDFRHNYAQWLVDNGTELETVRQLLGHKRLATVQIYARTRQDKIKTPV